VSTTRANCSSAIPLTRALSMAAAFATTTSGDPPFAPKDSNRASTAAESVTSHWTASALPWPLRIASTVASAPGLSV
jgi:hypothetical protein